MYVQLRIHLGKLESKKMKKFYSQAGQDEWIVNFFDSKRNGYFLDIGAHNGIDINNTYFLERELGWDGICVEADPKIFESLHQNRKCKCVNAAASDSSGEISFLPDGFSGRESTSRNSINVKSQTLKEIIHSYGSPKNIDYMSLDIEGMELKALKGFPFDDYEVLAITVEHNLYLGKSEYQREIREFLFSKGYSIYRENIESDGLPFEDWYIKGNLPK
jgi:FkbM family methyltransferase